MYKVTLQGRGQLHPYSEKFPFRFESQLRLLRFPGGCGNVCEYIIGFKSQVVL